MQIGTVEILTGAPPGGVNPAEGPAWQRLVSWTKPAVADMFAGGGFPMFAIQ